MTYDHNILTLNTSLLREIRTALQTGRLIPPYTATGLRHVVGAANASQLADSLTACSAQGLTTSQIAWILGQAIEGRASSLQARDSFELVLTGPESRGVAVRDTAAVVHGMFSQAKTLVLVAGYAIHRGDHIFKALADRMEAIPDLDVRMYLDIPGAVHTSEDGDVLSSSDTFARRFRESEWPLGYRLPKVFCYRRSNKDDSRLRSSMHAKCVIVDNATAFISSANFTNAAQERNVEVGVLIGSPRLASRLEQHFVLLAAAGSFTRII
jgi:phosphatidylserine/phosphatidylglycerophosphate/cardiolipin synthase-like enzyme